MVFSCSKYFSEVGKRSSALVSANTTNIMLQCMVRETEDNVSNDDILIMAHQVLAKLSNKGNFYIFCSMGYIVCC